MRGAPRIDRSGQQFEKLLVLRHIWEIEWVVCLCDCGRIWKGVTYSLVGGNTTSCGCSSSRHKNKVGRNNGQFKHGDSYLSEYRTWAGMLQRCYNPKASRYKDYGGRGITVDPLWRTSYEAFIFDVGKKPHWSFSLERLDNERGYCQQNCVWSDAQSQALNRR